MRTAAMGRKKTTTSIKTAAITETIAMVEITAIVARAPKVFKKEAIIAEKRETATIAARTSKKGSATSFNKGEKYVLIKDNAPVFA